MIAQRKDKEIAGIILINGFPTLKWVAIAPIIREIMPRHPIITKFVSLNKIIAEKDNLRMPTKSRNHLGNL